MPTPPSPFLSSPSAIVMGRSQPPANDSGSCILPVLEENGIVTFTGAVPFKKTNAASNGDNVLSVIKVPLYVFASPMLALAVFTVAQLIVNGYGLPMRFHP